MPDCRPPPPAKIPRGITQLVAVAGRNTLRRRRPLTSLSDIDTCSAAPAPGTSALLHEVIW